MGNIPWYRRRVRRHLVGRIGADYNRRWLNCNAGKALQIGHFPPTKRRLAALPKAR
jgi:hypothetical protein